MEYTRGEWEIESRLGRLQYGIFTRRGEVSMPLAFIRLKADAHLISAAPDMYKALKLYQSHQQGTSGHYCWQCAEVINKALAKAEGVPSTNDKK